MSPYQIPQYLDNHLLSRLRPTPGVSADMLRITKKLKQYHEDLSANSSGKIFSRLAWVTDDNRHTCELDPDGSVAHNLDIFQKSMAESSAQDLSICAINANTDEVISQLNIERIWYAFIRDGTRPCFQELLRIVIENHWQDSATKIENIIREMRAPQKLSWHAKFPSQAGIHTVPRRAILNDSDQAPFEFELQYMHEAPFLGTQDWSLYVSEPLLSHPELATLRVVDVSAPNSGHRRIAFIGSSGSSLEIFKRLYDEQIQNSPPATNARAAEQLRISFIACFSCIRDSVASYIQQRFNQVESLVSLILSNTDGNLTNCLCVLRTWHHAEVLQHPRYDTCYT